MNNMGKNNKYNIDDGMKEVFSRIGNQEETITNLIDKYSERKQYPHHTIDVVHQLPTAQLQKLSDQRSVGKGKGSLPKVRSKKQKYSAEVQHYLPTPQKKVTPAALVQQSMYERKKLRQDLYQIYGHDNQFVHKKSAKVHKKKHHTQLTPITPQTPIPPPQQTQVQKKQVDFSLQIDEDASSYYSSEGEDVALTYHQHEFKNKMKGQCMEQLNFLYFSRNQNMKDWTESLLSMFEKHDKEILAIKRKNKYLHTFDDHFFSVGILQND